MLIFSEKPALTKYDYVLMSSYKNIIQTALQDLGLSGIYININKQSINTSGDRLKEKRNRSLQDQHI